MQNFNKFSILSVPIGNLTDKSAYWIIDHQTSRPMDAWRMICHSCSEQYGNENAFGAIFLLSPKYA